MSSDMQHQQRKWNIFARELENILLVHGFRIGHLDDRSGIHPEKVRRLQRSLDEPKFNVLSPDDLERVSHDFGFSKEEELRLRAALLATAMEEMLMDRINADAALAAAEQFFPLLLETLQAHSDELDGIGAVKGKGDPTEASQEDKVDPIEDAINDIDGALTALYLSYVDGRNSRSSHASQARDEFTSAIAKLDALTANRTVDEIYKIWHAAAYSGYLASERLLAQVHEST